MITTACVGRTSWFCGNFYHEVSIYRDGDLIDRKQVMCCDDEEEATLYAISISKELTQEEKDNFVF